MVRLSAAVFVGSIYIPLLKRKNWRECLLRGVLLLAAGLLGAGCWMSRENTYLAEQNRLFGNSLSKTNRIHVSGTLIRKVEKGNGWQLTMKLPSYQNLVIVSTEDGDYPLDCVLSVEGPIREFNEPRCEGQFNQKQYQKCRRMLGQIKAQQLTCLYHPRGIHAWREWLFVLRMRVCEVYGRCLPVQESGMMSAMVTGETSLLDGTVRTLFQRAGFSHILAISGMHISLIGMGCYQLLRRCRCSYPGSAVITALFLLLYGELIGAGVSAQRAIGMFGIYLLAQCLGRRSDLCASLSVLVVVLLLDNPFLLYDASFQFSFLAVAAVAITRELMPNSQQTDKTSDFAGRCRRACLSLFVPVMLQLFTLPLVAYRYYELPVYALLCNLLLLPYAAVVVGCGFAGGLAGLFSEQLAQLILYPCRIVLSVYVWVCEQTGKLPGAVWICGRPSGKKLCIYYGSLFLFAVVMEQIQLYMRKKWFTQMQQCLQHGREQPEKLSALHMRIAGRIAFDIWPMAVILFCFLACPPANEHGFELDYLDVGQGDGAMIRTQEDVVCMIDGGSSDVSGVGTYRLLPFLKSKGIRRVDYWILSHLDEDHVNGFYEVLASGYEIGRVIVSDRLPDDEAKKQLLAQLDDAHIPLVQVQGGQMIDLKKKQQFVHFRHFHALLAMLHGSVADRDDSLEKSVLHVLSPAQTTPAADANGASLVVLYEDALARALFTGDIGSEQEQWLFAQGMVQPVDVYKAAHHGSKYANTAPYLKALSPKISVVSCGAHNRYGHPSQEAVANIAASGSRILYTMDSGQIRIRRRGSELVAASFCKNSR